MFRTISRQPETFLRFHYIHYRRYGNGFVTLKATNKYDRRVNQRYRGFSDDGSSLARQNIPTSLKVCNIVYTCIIKLKTPTHMSEYSRKFSVFFTLKCNL